MLWEIERTPDSCSYFEANQHCWPMKVLAARWSVAANQHRCHTGDQKCPAS
jgi:hypothetical protein